MSEVDLVIRGAVLVTPDKAVVADVSVDEGLFASISPSFPGHGREEIDGQGLHLFPGFIDTHVHFNEPGRTEWEGFDTGSQALAAAGTTCFAEMPLNALPPTLDRPSFLLKKAAAEASSHVDFTLWGGLVPQNLHHLEELRECGVIGLKAFLSNSGVPEFSAIDFESLREGMHIAAQLGLPVAIHAESEELTARLTLEKQRAGLTGIRDYLGSRPIQAETDAIHRICDIAGETACPVHIVHVSSPEGIACVADARAAGVDVTAETCPHYLLLDESDMERIGAAAKCAPPLRSSDHVNALWEDVRKRRVDTIGSDHSPSPASMKEGTDFFKIWGGISSCQHALPLFLARGYHEEGIHPVQLAAVVATHVARRFRLGHRKGAVIPGLDADFTLVDFNDSFEITEKGLLYRHKITPYLGRTVNAVVHRTVVRGQTVFADGKVRTSTRGRFLSPH